jgi:hypothetical protein
MRRHAIAASVPILLALSLATCTFALGSESDASPTETPLAGTGFTTHDDVVVDGRSWSLTTYMNMLRQQCLITVVPGGGGSLSCAQPGRPPLPNVFHASMQAKPVPRRDVWKDAWVFGKAGRGVRRVAIVSTDCSPLPVTLDKSGFFLAVITERRLYHGSWPAWALGFNAVGKVVAKQKLRLPDPKMQIVNGHPRPVYRSPPPACIAG